MTGAKGPPSSPIFAPNVAPAIPPARLEPVPIVAWVLVWPDDFLSENSQPANRVFNNTLPLDTFLKFFRLFNTPPPLLILRFFIRFNIPPPLLTLRFGFLIFSLVFGFVLSFGFLLIFGFFIVFFIFGPFILLG